MSFLDEITVLVLTYNEEANIGRSLGALSRFPSVVVLDSESNDQTIKMIGTFSNARLLIREFDSHASQWNFGLTQCGISTSWVLALDADYVFPVELVDEIAGLSPKSDVVAYRAHFKYCVFGRLLSGTLYPAVSILFRRDGAKYAQSGHTQRLHINGRVADLRNRAYHDDRKSLSRWITSQQKYAKLEADFLLDAPRSSLRLSDKIRRLAWPAPIFVFLYTLLIKRCIFDGWHGWFYVLQRTIAEALIALEITHARVRRAADHPRAK